MDCTRTDHDLETTVSISGELTAANAHELAPVFDGIVADRRMTVVLELSGLSQFDVEAGPALIGLRMRVHQYGGTVTQRGVDGQPGAIFKLLRWDKVFG